MFKVFLSLESKVQEGRNHICPVRCYVPVGAYFPHLARGMHLDNGVLNECVSMDLSLPLCNLCSSV